LERRWGQGRYQGIVAILTAEKKGILDCSESDHMSVERARAQLTSCSLLLVVSMEVA
jgi:hypothetical protein